MAFCSLASKASQFGGRIGDGRSDSRPMEPVGALHNGIKIEVGRLGLAYRRTGTVVDNLRRTHADAGFGIINTYAVTATGNVACIDAITAQCIDGALAYLVGRKFSNESGMVAIVGTTDSHIGFTTTINHIESVSLHKTHVLARRRQPEHYLA